MNIREWIDNVRKKFALPDRTLDPFWEGYDACLRDLEHRIDGDGQWVSRPE